MRNRRGLSTVVGAVFFVIAATTVITYISYSMNSIDQFAQSVIVSETENINRGMEEISISQATIDGGEFNATVINTGSLPVKITRLWVVNEDTGANSKADLDILINPGNQDFIDSTGISVDSDTSYTLKAVTSRGNIATFAVSPITSTQMQIIIPEEVAPEQRFTVVSMITNNSTSPNNIANLVPTITNNATLIQVDNISPASIAVLPQGRTATFTSSWVAPDTTGPVMFTANYTGAPSGAGVSANMTVAISTEAEEATQSQWSQAASRVGILISGIPNPISSVNDDEWGKYGMGIINPLDREVEVYAVGITFSDPTLTLKLLAASESEGWEIRDLGGRQAIIFEYGDTPATIAAKSVGQFLVQFDIDKSDSIESDIIISSLTSEGKLTVRYSIMSSNQAGYPLMNVFYSTDTIDPVGSWTYILDNISSGVNQQFNATIQNSGGAWLNSKAMLLILVPSDFTNVQHVASAGWNTTKAIKENPDGSHIIEVMTTANVAAGSVKTYKFTADTPTVSDDKLYVFQTTTVYPSFCCADKKSQLVSALSEAGVEVVPP